MVKKKIAIRVASLALCAVFTASVFGAPKSKAVAVETAIGTAAVASYFQATGLTMAASAGSTGALVTTGVADIVGSYAVATGAASSGSAFLSSLAAGVSISPAGALVLTAAAVVAIGALVAWYIGDAGLGAEGDTAVAVPGTSDFYSYNGVVLPNIESVWVDKETYPFAFVYQNPSNEYWYLYFCSNSIFQSVSDSKYYFEDTFGSFSVVKNFERGFYQFDSDSWLFIAEGSSYQKNGSFGSNPLTWASYSVLCSDSSVSLSFVDAVPVGDVQDQLEVTRAPEFAQPDTEFETESQKQMVIDLGFTPGITLDEAVELVPEQIAAGTLAPTYEITTDQTGEGEGTEQPDDSLVYVPWFERIQTSIGNLGKSIVDGILDGVQGLFVPSEAYMEALPAQITDTFDERTGFLTYPFSLLPDFVGRLSAPSDDWILKWPQIAEPFTGTILFQQGSWNVTAFVQANAQIKRLYDLWRLIAKALMSFGFIGLCYNKYRSVVGDRYGEG